MNYDLQINDRTNRLYLTWLFMSRLIRFAIVGLSGVFVDLGGFYVLHTLLGWLLTPSAILSTEIAIINNFLWNDVWTFGDVSVQQQLVQRLQRFFKFNLICFFGLIFNALIVNWLFYRFRVNEYLAKLVAILCVTFWNFSLNWKVNWQTKETKVDVLRDGDKANLSIFMLMIQWI
ncbi:MAG: GtrA family protein [Nostoc sp. SerVER01]|uniref:GtrA family protein n=2 Tax=unclassified Nostoc TaxID=2593658 RepID=UPI002ADBA62C|nr:GtrA family protein [Nostoc sp. SerVER01]MDZ8023821.1 GtrA family protein [Nostoc sp. DedQUE11]MDZ8075491.1 GtrA family protein [Nostoc sp. DedQUE01]MDZ8081335.1 GtrA family protein [Nostoc sp. DcaGUA01]